MGIPNRFDISNILHIIFPSLFSLFLPVCSTLGLALAVPYIVAYDLVPRMVQGTDGGGGGEEDSDEVVVMIQRR